MTSRFLNFIPFIFQWEGGFDNDPDDPGGMTWFGIDMRSHPNDKIWRYVEQRHDPAIAAKAKERAQEIYFNEYWTAVHADRMPKNVGEVLMNIGVNAGNGRAVRWLQQALNVPVDGKIGSVTLAAAESANAPALAETLLDRTEAHYRSIARGRLAKFLRGWLNRNNSLRQWVAAHK